MVTTLLVYNVKKSWRLFSAVLHTHIFSIPLNWQEIDLFIIAVGSNTVKYLLCPDELFFKAELISCSLLPNKIQIQNNPHAPLQPSSTDNLVVSTIRILDTRYKGVNASDIHEKRLTNRGIKILRTKQEMTWPDMKWNESVNTESVWQESLKGNFRVWFNNHRS